MERETTETDKERHQLSTDRTQGGQQHYPCQAYSDATNRRRIPVRAFIIPVSIGVCCLSLWERTFYAMSPLSYSHITPVHHHGDSACPTGEQLVRWFRGRAERGPDESGSTDRGRGIGRGRRRRTLGWASDKPDRPLMESSPTGPMF